MPNINVDIQGVDGPKVNEAGSDPVEVAPPVTPNLPATIDTPAKIDRTSDATINITININLPQSEQKTPPTPAPVTNGKSYHNELKKIDANLYNAIAGISLVSGVVLPIIIIYQNANKFGEFLSEHRMPSLGEYGNIAVTVGSLMIGFVVYLIAKRKAREALRGILD